MRYGLHLWCRNPVSFEIKSVANMQYFPQPVEVDKGKLWRLD